MAIARACLTLVVLIGLCQCSSLSTTTTYDPEADFTAYRTFDWLPPRLHPHANPNVYDQLIGQWIRERVERDFATKGLRRGTTGRPDVLIAYSSGHKRKHEVIRDWDTYTYRERWSGELRTVTREQVYHRAYQEGTVSIGMFDPLRQNLVWYGGTTAELKSPEKDKELLTKALQKILVHYPPPVFPRDPLGPSGP